MKDADPIEALAERLRLYLAEHPQAADTEEGIATWWLRGANDLSRSQVSAALRVIEHEGLVRRVVQADGSTVFVRRPPQ